MNIDWSKAPEGATHFVECTKPEFLKAFFAVEDSDRYTEVGAQTFFRKRDESRPDWVVTPRPTERAAWTGEGLPPIGIDVEVFAEYSHPRFDRFLNQKVSVIAHDVINGDPVAVFRMPVDGDDTEQDYHAMVAGSFRPLRTSEQIAADEREAGITQMREIAGSLNTHPFAELWDAGYRKQAHP